MKTTIKSLPPPPPIENEYEPVDFAIINGIEVSQTISSDPRETDLYFFGDDHDCDDFHMVDIGMTHTPSRNEFKVRFSADTKEGLLKLLNQAFIVITALPAVGIPYVTEESTEDFEARTGCPDLDSSCGE